MAYFKHLGAYAGAIAAASMMIAPAQAAQTAIDTSGGTIGYATGVHVDFERGGVFNSSTFDEQADKAEWRDRRYRRHRGSRHHRRGVSGGDVLAGVLILGGIAAVANAASNNNRRDDRRYDDRRYDDRRYDNQRYDNRRYDDRRDNRRDDRQVYSRGSDSSGIDNAVSQCLAEIESDVRVQSVDRASRLPQGWLVEGTLFNGSGFTCQIGNDGRTSSIDYSGDDRGFSGSSYDGSYNGTSGASGNAGVGAGQLADSRYANARSAVRANGPDQTYSPPAERGPQPAYPGGPLPGETFSD